VENLSLEAQIVRISDALAYLAHDILDALRSEYIKLEELPADAAEALGVRHSQRVNAVITDVISSSWDCTGEIEVDGSDESASPESPEGGGDAKPWIRMSPELGKIVTDLRVFMFERFYHPISSSSEGRKAAAIVGVLLDHFNRNPDLIPDWIRYLSDSTDRAAADFVCGMTDNFALMMAEQIRPGLSDGVFQGRI
jgi:dGTPase